jgi:hypothetical protein
MSMKKLNYELCPRNGTFGDSNLSIDGYSMKLTVRYVLGGSDSKKTFLFQNVRTVSFESQSWIKRSVPGLLNQMERIVTEKGDVYRGLCEDFGYFEVISDDVVVKHE